MIIEEKLKTLGLQLPPVADPAGLMFILAALAIWFMCPDKLLTSIASCR